jgi:acyl-CoA synthetase (AMP-forming)/AMP-acid ligase II
MQPTTYNKQQSTLIHHFLENSAKAYPDKIALIHEKTRATYAEINAKANQLACWLLSRGICQGDRVVILLENSVAYVVAYYGILKAGAVAVPMSTGLKPDGLNPLLTELEPVAIISSTRFERLLQASDLNVSNLKTLIIHNPKLEWSGRFNNVFSFQEIINPIRRHRNKIPAQDQGGAEFQPAGILGYVEELEGGSNADIELEAVSATPSDLSCIIYTSGSTGTPKGVMLTHANIVANVASICEYLQLTDADIQMVVLPFFYVMGKSLLNTHFAVGGTIVINNKFAFPAAVIKQMVEEKVTGFSGVPSTYAYLLHRSPLAAYRDKLSSLRYCSQAGGHMAGVVKKKLRKVLPDHTQMVVMYGATEASARLTWLDPDRFDEKMDSIGKPIPGTKVQILDKRGWQVPTGKEGELLASGPNIMQGYWKDPAATAMILDANGYHTGDMGYADPEGFIYLVGRKDELVKVGGHRINPKEIEDVLLATNLIIEAAVLGIPDPLLGSRLAALAVSKNGDCSDCQILRGCAEKLPKYKLPSEVNFIRSLPKNANGKVDRKKCLELLTTGLPGRRPKN